MKRSTRIITGLRVSTLAILIIFLCFSCKRKDTELEVIPLIKPVLSSVEIKVGVNTATMAVTLIPNGDTRVYYELDNDLDSLPYIYNGEDLVEISIDIPNLERNTQYSLRVKATNAAGNDSSVINFKTFAAVDFDGNVYRSVIIGNQEWLAENLKTTSYSNGDIIPNITSSDLETMSAPAYCWYDNNILNKEHHGALYSWQTSVDDRELISGWHVPTYEECIELDSVLGGPIEAGPKLISLDYWINLVVPATNTSGFNAMPSGVMMVDSISGLVFTGEREEFSSWTKTEVPEINSKINMVWCAAIRNIFVVAEMQQQNKLLSARSIRPIKNK